MLNTKKKVVVGDSTGVVQLFVIKQKEPLVRSHLIFFSSLENSIFFFRILNIQNTLKIKLKNIFKTAPSKRITRIELAGKENEPCDRIFAASISNVNGYSKKGKQFFNFETNMTEPIKSM